MITKHEIIKNAKTAALRDGYDQIVYKDDNNEYCITRYQSNFKYTLLWYTDIVIGYAKLFYNNGIQQVKYISI